MSTTLVYAVTFWHWLLNTSGQKYITCGDSVTHYQYEFSHTLPYISKLNYTFIYNETMDQITITTCNNITTLDAYMYIYDENMTQVSNAITANSMVYNPNRGSYYCPYEQWISIVTSKLLPQQPYLIVLETNPAQSYPNQIIKLDVECKCDCNYIIKKANAIYNDVMIYDTIDIQFNIKLYSQCAAISSCNIFQIGSSEYQCLPKLSINGTNNNFIIQFTNNYQNNIFEINKSIEYDQEYHNIKLTINNDQLLFSYDNMTYLNVTKNNFFMHSNYEYNMIHKLYLSNTYEEALNATIDKIYINSFISNEYIIANSTNYILVSKQLNWNDAELFCENRFNGTLALIQDDNQLKEIINLRNNLGENIKYLDLWIALNKQQSDGHWTWYGSVSDANNALCDLNVIGDCVEDPYWNYRHSFFGDLSCAFIIGGIEDTDIAFLDANCENVYNAFLCDTRTQYKSFSNIGLGESKFECNYYQQNEANITSNNTIFNNIRLGTELRVSFDIKLNSNHICETEKCNLFSLGTETNNGNYYKFHRIMSVNVHKTIDKSYNLQLEIVNDQIVEYIDINFDFDLVNYYKYLRMNFLISTNKQVFKFDGKTYFFKYTDINLYAYIMNFTQYSLFMSSRNDIPMNAIIKNICIQSNMVRNNSIWYSLANIEDHSALKFVRPSVHSFDNTYLYPIFYYQNQTIILFNDYFWIKYIAYDQLYRIVKQVQSYPYYKNSGNENDIPSVFSCGFIEGISFSNQTCNIYPIKNPSSQQWVQHNEMVYLVSTDNTGSSFLKISKFLPKFGVKNIITWKIPNVLINYGDNTCITTNNTHIFLINRGIIILRLSENVFDGTSGDIVINMSVSNVILNESSVACATNNENDFIYIFGGEINNSEISNNVYKYYIFSDKIELIDTKLKDPIYKMRAIITDHNNKIYLYGGINIHNNTMRQIFNIETETFDDKQIDDGNYAYTTAVFNNDHKIIMRYNNKNQQFEYFIPELLSIDLSVIETNVW
eukprot:515737_1